MNKKLVATLAAQIVETAKCQPAVANRLAEIAICAGAWHIWGLVALQQYGEQSAQMMEVLSFLRQQSVALDIHVDTWYIHKSPTWFLAQDVETRRAWLAALSSYDGTEEATAGNGGKSG